MVSFNADNTNPTTNNQPAVNTALITSSPYSNKLVPKKGSTQVCDKLTLSIEDVYESTAPKYDYASEGAKYVYVRLKVLNSDKIEREIYSSYSLSLFYRGLVKESDWRKDPPDMKGISSYSLMGENVFPGSAYEGWLTYEVPQGLNVEEESYIITDC